MCLLVKNGLTECGICRRAQGHCVDQGARGEATEAYAGTPQGTEPKRNAELRNGPKPRSYSGQAYKGARGMPRHGQAMKGVVSCEKRRIAARRL